MRSFAAVMAAPRSSVPPNLEPITVRSCPQVSSDQRRPQPRSRPVSSARSNGNPNRAPAPGPYGMQTAASDHCPFGSGEISLVGAIRMPIGSRARPMLGPRADDDRDTRPSPGTTATALGNLRDRRHRICAETGWTYSRRDEKVYTCSMNTAARRPASSHAPRPATTPC